MVMSQAMVTLILGGARSGKSHYAQALAARAEDVVVLAPLVPSDEEMRIKVERHRRERPATWKTVESPFDLDRVVTQYGTGGAFLLIDCLTTYTANLMTAENGNSEAILRRIDCLCSALASTSARVAIVSNEVGSGVVPAYASGCQFRDLLGEANQRIAGISRNVVLMIAGCPFPVKGSLEAEP